ncbi:hypothetical protein JW979_03485, partial [bacterium]|nr:hypothetical protein [candidate division CSSED10-310 bacterium]
MKRVESFRKQFRWALLAGDLILVPLMYYLSYWLRSKTSFLLFDDVIPPDRYFWISHFLWFLVAAHIIFVYFHGLYDRLITYTTNQIIFRSIRAVTLELLVFVAFYFFRLDVAFPRSIIILLWFFIVGSTAIWRVFLVRLYQGRVPQRNLLIVGTTSAAETLLKEIERLPSYRLKVIGILTQTNDTLKTDKFCGYPVLGNRNDILQIVEQYNIHEV